MNINSTSYNPYTSSGGMGMQRPPQKAPDKTELAKIGTDFFSQLDTQQKGYLQQSDFENILSQDGANDTGEDLFNAMDSNADGQLTSEEFSTAFSNILYNQQGMQGNMSAPPGPGDMPPPPPPQDMATGGMQAPQDNGKTADEITQMISDINQFDSDKASELQNVLDNFSDADTNADGKITMAEIKAYTEPEKTEQSTETGKTLDELNTLANDIKSFDPQAAKGLQSLLDNFASADANSDGKMSSSEAQAFQQSLQNQQDNGTSLNKQLQKLIANYTMDFSRSLNANSLSVSA